MCKRSYTYSVQLVPTWCTYISLSLASCSRRPPGKTSAAWSGDMRADHRWGPGGPPFTDLRLVNFGGKGLLAVVRSAAKKSGVALPLIEAAVKAEADARNEAAHRVMELFALQLAQNAMVSTGATRLQKVTQTIPLGADTLEYTRAVKIAADLHLSLMEAIDVGVPDAVVQQGVTKLSEVNAGIRRSRQVAELMLSLEALAPIACDASALRTSYARAELLHADEIYLLEARNAMAAMQRCDDAKAVIDQLLDSDATAQDVQALRTACTAGVVAGVPVETIKLSLSTLTQATNARIAPEYAAERVAQLHARMDPLPASALLISADMERLDAAYAELAVHHQPHGEANEPLRALKRQVRLRDTATSSLVALACQSSHSSAEVAVLRELLPAAKSLGVAVGILEAVASKLNSATAGSGAGARPPRLAEDMEKQANMRLEEAETAHRAAQQRLHDATLAHEAIEREIAAMVSRPSERTTAACCLTAALDYNQARLPTSHHLPFVGSRCGQVGHVAKADAYFARKLEVARTVHAEMGPHANDAAHGRRVARHAWRESKTTREQLAAKHAKMATTLQVREEARHVAADAASDVRVAQNEVARVAQQLGALGPIPHVPDTQVEQAGAKLPVNGREKRSSVARKKGGLGGRSGEHEPDRAAAISSPATSVVDGLAWAHYEVSTGSAAQLELVLVLALAGYYEDGRLCATVAADVCSTSVDIAESFVLCAVQDFADGGVPLIILDAKLATGSKSRSRAASWTDNVVHAVARTELPRAAPGSSSKHDVALDVDPSSGAADLEAARRLPARVGSAHRHPRIDETEESAQPIEGRMGRAISEGFTNALVFGARRAKKVSGGQVRQRSRIDVGAVGLGKVVDIWLEHLARRDHRYDGLAIILEQLLLPQYAEHSVSFGPCTRGLLEGHRRIMATTPPATTGDDEVVASRPLHDLFRCLSILLSASMRSPAVFRAMLSIWTDTADKSISPGESLLGAATVLAGELGEHVSEYSAHRDRSQLEPSDRRREQAILALIALFVARPDSLTGFQKLVPRVFDVYLCKGSKLRGELCTMLANGGMEQATVRRIGDDDELVRQVFFWSAPGMKLFGGHADLREPVKLKALLEAALEQQPTIVVAFLDEALRRAQSNAAEEAGLGQLVRSSLEALLDFISRVGLANVTKGTPLFVERVLYASTRHPAVYDQALAAWSGHAASNQVLEHFATEFFLPKLHARREAASSNTSPARGGGHDLHEPWVILTLARLFIARPDAWTAFARLVPDVFDTHLSLGSELRKRLNTLLLATDFDSRLEQMIANSDAFVKAPFFWNAAVMPLCTRARIGRDYATLNTATMTAQDGTEIHLYSRFLALLLRLSSYRGGEAAEIARRTKEVLDQFERNADQQVFMMRIFETLDERSLREPDAFSDIPLTLLSEVAQNGVQTLSSVSGDGMELCERAMTTLLEGYITEHKPSDWKRLFKDATNIAFMIKYMFRENLPIAREKFLVASGATAKQSAIKRRAADVSKEVLAMIQALVQKSITSYGVPLPPPLAAALRAAASRCYASAAIASGRLAVNTRASSDVRRPSVRKRASIQLCASTVLRLTLKVTLASTTQQSWLRSTS